MQTFNQYTGLPMTHQVIYRKKSYQISMITELAGSYINKTNDCIMITLQAKKVVLFPEIDRVKNFYHSLARIVECASEYQFLITKNKLATTKNKNTKKAKETKGEKRISPKNRLK